jgi:Zn-dependent membrane protease YugP
VLKKHNQREIPLDESAKDLARELLDKHGLQAVKVEVTDVGDHYDPVAKVVRLGRDKFDRRTLTAVTTAAHEAAHAIQDASGYRPFVWRTRLVKVARVAGDIGAVLFLTVPVVAMFSRHRVPPILIGSVALAMLGTGVIAQLAALPSEWDASFGRALPMLRNGYISEAQAQDASDILLACSLTYVASSLVAVLHIWPWIGSSPAALLSPAGSVLARRSEPRRTFAASRSPMRRSSVSGLRRSAQHTHPSNLETLVRLIGKPLVRAWFRVAATARESCRP